MVLRIESGLYFANADNVRARISDAEGGHRPQRDAENRAAAAARAALPEMRSFA